MYVIPFSFHDLRCARPILALHYFMFLVVLSAIVFLGVLSARNASVQYHMVQGFAQWVHIVTLFAYSTLNVFPVNVHMVKTLLFYF